MTRPGAGARGAVEGFKGDEAMGTSRTTEVTVIGLGNTGRQLARVLLEKGKTVTVWNRSSQRSAEFRELGAAVAPSPAEAMAASPLTVLCVIDYEAAGDILAQPGVIEALRGRTLAQLRADHDEQVRSQYLTVKRAEGRIAWKVDISALIRFRRFHRNPGYPGGQKMIALVPPSAACGRNQR